MRKFYRVTIWVATAFSVAIWGTEAQAAIPKPTPRESAQQSPAQNVTVVSSDLDVTLERLRREYPDLGIPESADVRWPAPTGKGADADLENALNHGAPVYVDVPNPYAPAEDTGDNGDIDPATPEQLRDARLAQSWMDVEEDLEVRDVDKKALELVKAFGRAQNVMPPAEGQNGAVSYAYGALVPKILCRPNRVTDIALQAGEKVTAVHAGDTTRWQISPAKSGSGAGETVHVVIKPLVPDVSTNLLVLTDRRTYSLDLVSSAKDFLPSVRFTYPDDTVAAWDAFIADTRKRDGVVLSESRRAASPEDLHFGYSLSGKNVPWKPVRVWDDGTKTYIEMPEKTGALEAPVLLFYEGLQQKLVNYRVKGKFYVVDRLMTKKAVLIAGKSRVVIERQDEGRAR